MFSTFKVSGIQNLVWGLPDEIRRTQVNSKNLKKKLCGLNPSKSQKTKTFVWELIEGFNLERRFLTHRKKFQCKV
jgi:hypothetical protein